jgi:hypothetical protein
MNSAVIDNRLENSLCVFEMEREPGTPVALPMSGGWYAPGRGLRLRHACGTTLTRFNR